MRIAITGAGGQLGRALRGALSLHEVVAWTRADVDVCDAVAVRAAVDDARPEVIVHCAAYTDVDGCERDPARARAVNADGSAHIADAARVAQAMLVVVSTDYVFDGDTARPYTEDDATNPIQVYGATKLAGEQAAQATAPRCAVVRTSWLYDLAEPQGFVAVVSSRGRVGEPFPVIDDQMSTPTRCTWLAERLVELIEARATGLFHRAESAILSRADLARFVLSAGGLDPELVVDTPASRLPAPLARRPRFSALTSIHEVHAHRVSGPVDCDC